MPAPLENIYIDIEYNFLESPSNVGLFSDWNLKQIKGPKWISDQIPPHFGLLKLQNRVGPMLYIHYNTWCQKHNVSGIKVGRLVTKRTSRMWKWKGISDWKLLHYENFKDSYDLQYFIGCPRQWHMLIILIPLNTRNLIFTKFPKAFAHNNDCYPLELKG